MLNHLQLTIRQYAQSYTHCLTFTPQQQKLFWVASTIFILMFVLSAIFYPVNWAWWQYLIACWVVFDTCSCLLAETLTPSLAILTQPWQKRLPVLMFQIQPFIIILLFSDFPPWSWAIGLYGAMLLSAVILQRTDRASQQPLSICLFILYIITISSTNDSPEMFEWFGPIYLLRWVLLPTFLIKKST